MNAKLRVTALAALPLFMLLTGCAKAGTTPQADASQPAGAAPAASASTAAPAPVPTYPDVTKGDSKPAAKVYSFDAVAHSAVIEPVIFMEGPTYCKKYKIKESDERCNLEVVIEDSHQKVAVPVSPDAKYFSSWSDEKDCVGSVEGGGSCEVPTAKFASMVKAEQPDGLIARVTIVDGTATRLAEEYQP